MLRAATAGAPYERGYQYGPQLAGPIRRRAPTRPLRAGGPGAAKHGLLGLTKTAAMEHAAQGVRVNAVCPGLIDTPMADAFTGGPKTEAERFFLSLKPLRRRGTPEEVAAAAVWLCSAGASFVTGHALAVDGGFLTI